MLSNCFYGALGTRVMVVSENKVKANKPAMNAFGADRTNEQLIIACVARGVRFQPLNMVWGFVTNDVHEEHLRVVTGVTLSIRH
jgi:hypothetical protein